jgi:hypothetical protein
MIHIIPRFSFNSIILLHFLFIGESVMQEIQCWHCGNFFPKSPLIPPRYRLVADLLLFCTWVFAFMALIRVFTFMGYAGSIRASLMLGGITYLNMPDFSPGRLEDAAFLGIPLLIIALRMYLLSRKKRRREKDAL